MNNQTLNLLTGIMGFLVWTYLSYLTPEHSVNLALGSLLMLVGFAGKETIVDIVKSFKNQ